MNVILLEKLGKLGQIGDTASVKAGYARNYLFPQGKAIAATKSNLEHFETRRADLMAAHDSNVAASQTRAKVVDGAVLDIEVNASDEGHLFGSVGTKEVADALNEQTGSDLTKAEVLMPTGVIRELGSYELALDMGYDVVAHVTVNVASQQAASGVSDDGNMIDEIDEAEAEEAAAAEAVAAGEDTPAEDDSEN